MMKNADILYLAGIIDGEGTIEISKQERKYKICIRVGNTSEILIDYLKEKYLGNKYGPYKKKSDFHRDAFEWKCTAKEAIKLIKQIEPYLIVKQEQALLAIRAWEDTFKNNYHDGSNRIPKYAFDKRESYYQQMKHLNFRGKLEEIIGELKILKSKYVITFDNYERVSEIIIKNEEVSKKEEKHSTIDKKSKLLYLAAMVDGEGTIGVYKHGEKTYRLNIRIPNTSEKLIDYLKRNYKGNKGGPIKGKQENWKDIFVWTCHSEYAFKIIKQIQPYLIIKQEQANLAIEAWNNVFKIDYTGRDIPQYVIDKREEYYQQTKQLNNADKQEEDEQNEEEIEITLKINKNTLKKWLEESE